MITMKTEAAADLRPYIDIPTHAMPALEPNLNLDFELDCLNFSFPHRVWGQCNRCQCPVLDPAPLTIRLRCDPTHLRPLRHLIRLILVYRRPCRWYLSLIFGLIAPSGALKQPQSDIQYHTHTHIKYKNIDINRTVVSRRIWHIEHPWGETKTTWETAEKFKRWQF